MLQYTRLIVGGQSVAIEESSCWGGEMKVLRWKHRTSSVKIDVFSMQQVQTHSASTERGSVESLCLVQDLSGQPPALASEWKIWIHNWQYATRHSHYILYLYIYILCLWFMLAVPHHIKYPISPISSDMRWFLFWLRTRGESNGGGSLLSALNFRERASHLPQYSTSTKVHRTQVA